MGSPLCTYVDGVPSLHFVEFCWMGTPVHFGEWGPTFALWWILGTGPPFALLWVGPRCHFGEWGPPFALWWILVNGVPPFHFGEFWWIWSPPFALWWMGSTPCTLVNFSEWGPPLSALVNFGEWGPPFLTSTVTLYSKFTSYILFISIQYLKVTKFVDSQQVHAISINRHISLTHIYV